MQRFGYHSHTIHSDGINTPQEMIERATQIGFENYGISDHFNCHEANNRPYPGRFNDWKIAREYWKKSADKIREEAAKASIQVYLGFEIDFFQSANWRREFEKTLQTCDYDYLIGSTHVIKNPDEKLLYSLYHAYETPDIDPALFDSYWCNVKECIKSGYFNFIGHIDLFEKFRLTDKSYEKEKDDVIKALVDNKMPVELNTSGMNKFGEFHPSTPLLKKLNEAGVPVIISDDSHSVADLGQHFEAAEKLLAQIGYQNRYDVRTDLLK